MTGRELRRKIMQEKQEAEDAKEDADGSDLGRDYWGGYIAALDFVLRLLDPA